MRVQISPNPQAELSPLPLSRAQNIYGQEALQMKQEQIGQMTRGASQLAAVAVDALARKKEEEDAAQVAEAQAELSRRMDKLRFGDGDKPGLFARQGADAAGIEQEGMTAFAKQRDELAQGMPSEKARRVFERSMLGEEEQIRRGFIGHREKEMAGYRAGQTQAAALLALDAAHDPRINNDEAESRLIRARVNLRAAFAGQSPEQIAASQEQLGSKFARGRIEAAPDLASAQAAQERYGKLLTGEDALAAAKILEHHGKIAAIADEAAKIRSAVDAATEGVDLADAALVGKAVETLRKLPDAKLAGKAEAELVQRWRLDAALRQEQQQAVDAAASHKLFSTGRLDPEDEASVSPHILQVWKTLQGQGDKQAAEAIALNAKAKLVSLSSEELQKLPTSIAQQLYLQLDKEGRNDFEARIKEAATLAKSDDAEALKKSEAAAKQHLGVLLDAAALADADIPKINGTRHPQKVKDQIRLTEVWQDRVKSLRDSRKNLPPTEAELRILRAGLLAQVQLADGTTLPAWKLSDSSRQQFSTRLAKDDEELRAQLGVDPVLFHQLSDALSDGEVRDDFERLIFGRTMEQQTDIENAFNKAEREARAAAAQKFQEEELRKMDKYLKRGVPYSPAIPALPPHQRPLAPVEIDWDKFNLKGK